ncbi:MAG TPA: hypothetical protein VHG08_18900 [Longimicrobium sp.]|nr:hypothetical protein [Longimicrobium sp.]
MGCHGSRHDRGTARRDRICAALGRLRRVRAGTDFRLGASGRHLKGSTMKSEASVPFVVGKLGKDDKRLVVLEEKTPPPIQGPFELRAVFSK